ncbi:MAG: hypothetical protein HC912_09070 [Saprospiraceae bacterium]|nr:hypothetical protein [Saprospiraceae bacterium]
MPPRASLRVIIAQDENAGNWYCRRPIGTPKSIRRFLTMFDNPQLEYLHIEPKDIGTDKIGHFDFFRSRFKDSLWQDCLMWLKSL